MNRIILIGNGFDLAHGLKTSYGDFIDWYWNRWQKELRTNSFNTIYDELCKISLVDNNRKWLEYLYTNLSQFSSPRGRDFYNYLRRNADVKIDMCIFMNNICQSIETKGWVDIENEYYNLLVKGYEHKIEDLSRDKLNQQLDFVRRLLCEYLNTLPIDTIEFKSKIGKIINGPFNPNDISITKQNDLKEHVNHWINSDQKEFNYQMWKYNKTGIDSYDQIDYKSKNEKLGLDEMYMNYPGFFLPNNILLLNFNYTSTTEKYIETKRSIAEIYHIHGELSKPESVIFGYGDEMDENYKKLSDLNDNEYLKNFKSIKYLESDRYRKALQFMEAEPYQVYIMGHSCGNSDRTFLNTLFEHKNCVSIKPYYYKDGDKDNYLDIVQNISRNFTDMKLMRDRVVNKTYCEAFSER